MKRIVASLLNNDRARDEPRAVVVPVHPVLYTVTPIEVCDGHGESNEGTGFFYLHGGDLFLVTARHMVVDEEERFSGDHIHLSLHSRTDPSASCDYVVSLFGPGKTPRGRDLGADIDLAAVELDRGAIGEHFFISAFTQDNLYPPGRFMPLAQPVLILGYPLGFYDEKANLPIVRHGTIASVYGMNFDGERNFVTEARMHGGMSGSPVLMKAGPERDAVYLLGVHSGPWTMEDSGDQAQDQTQEDADEEDEDEGPLDLNVVWAADLIEEMLS